MPELSRARPRLQGTTPFRNPDKRPLHATWQLCPQFHPISDSLANDWTYTSLQCRAFPSHEADLHIALSADWVRSRWAVGTRDMCCAGMRRRRTARA